MRTRHNKVMNPNTLHVANFKKCLFFRVGLSRTLSRFALDWMPSQLLQAFRRDFSAESGQFDMPLEIVTITLASSLTFCSTLRLNY